MTVTTKSIKLAKTATGIAGLDEILDGGLPKDRPALICGSAGCGKTLLALEFLIRGAMTYKEPGVFMAFEETADDLRKNVASLGFNLEDLEAKKLIKIDYVRIERSEIEETGEYDLEGLFIRLGNAIDSIGAKRVVLDTIESLFAGLDNQSVLRAELRRLFGWLKQKGVTAIITGERGDQTLTRQGLEEYVSDCVILLDHRITDQVSTRRLRVVKFRGSTHGTNEYPFLIDEKGITVLPITSLGLNHPASMERVSTGVERLDTMLGGNGYYKGSSVLISGTAGTGKTSLAAFFAEAACRSGGKCLYFSFEESEQQILRNMRSIGLNLAPWVKKQRLHFFASRPTLTGLEQHLVRIYQQVEKYKPSAVVIDPITNLSTSGTEGEVQAMITRVVDYLKGHQITALFTTLTSGAGALESTDLAISSLVDTWLQVRDLEANGERNRGLFILKSRGMPHSNQVREFILSDKGIELINVYTGHHGTLLGSARLEQESQDAIETGEQVAQASKKRREVERETVSLRAQMVALQAEMQAHEDELKVLRGEDHRRREARDGSRLRMESQRHADAVPTNGHRRYALKETL